MAFRGRLIKIYTNSYISNRFRRCPHKIRRAMNLLQKNREGYWVCNSHRQCTNDNCGIFFKKTNNNTLCNNCNSTRVKSNTPEWKMHQRAKNRCAKSGREFTIEPHHIAIPEVCPILGITLKVHTGQPGAFKDSPSLDRIDNDQGYTPENIQVISQLANNLKGAASIEQLQQFAVWVLESYPIDKEK